MRPFDPSARPPAALSLLAVLLATACGTGQPGASGAPASARLLAAPSTSAPAATSTAQPSESPGPASLHNGALSAGTYVINPSTHPTWIPCPEPTTPGCSDPPEADTIRITLDVPDGWAGVADIAVWLAAAEAAPPAGASLGFSRGGWLHPDPCRTDTALPNVEVGPTVDDFANALAGNPNLEVTTPVDVTLAGYSGKYVDLQVPFDISPCPTSYFVWEPGSYAQGPGQRWHLWIVDVGGVRVVMKTTDYAGTSPRHQAEVEAMIDSIRIDR